MLDQIKISMHTSTDILINRLKLVPVKIGSINCHYRNPSKHYVITDVVLDESTEKPMIIYKSLADDQLSWARLYDVWNEDVDDNGKIVKRFSEVDKPKPKLFGDFVLY